MHRRIIASYIILFMIFSGFRNEDLEQTGLLGKSVTLPSGVTKPGIITIIEWSVFTNETYIAVFSGGQQNVSDRQRLKLNTTTGDLMIQNLRKEDSGTYTVRIRNKEGGRWLNKVSLSVQEELPEPKITVINRTVQHGMCNIFLTCSVKNKSTVTITCGPGGFSHGCEFNHLHYVTMGREVEAWCSPIQDVNVTCTANDSMSTKASTVTTGCSKKEKISVPDECRASSGSTNLGVIIILIIIIIILCFIIKKRDALSEIATKSWKRLTEWLPFLPQRSDDEDKDANHIYTASSEEAAGQVSTDPESQRLLICDEVPVKDSNMAVPDEESSKKKENCDDTQPKETAEGQCGQVPTEPEPVRSEQFVHDDTPFSGNPRGTNGNP